MSIIDTVASQNLKQFPNLLTAAREAAGLSQKALARAIGIDQSRLCAIERGRVLLRNAELEHRLFLALGCTTEVSGRIRLAAQHDRAIEALTELGVTKSLLLVMSASLATAQTLDDQERAGLASHLAEICRSKQILATTLAHSAASQKEAAMS